MVLTVLQLLGHSPFKPGGINEIRERGEVFDRFMEDRFSSLL